MVTPTNSNVRNEKVKLNQSNDVIVVCFQQKKGAPVTAEEDYLSV